MSLSGQLHVRRGLTLLEVMLALVLSTLLLAAALQTAYLAGQYRIRHDELNHVTNMSSQLYLDFASDIQASEPYQTPSSTSILPSQRLLERIQGATDNLLSAPSRPTHIRCWGTSEAFLLQSSAWNPRLGNLQDPQIASGVVTVIWWHCKGKAIQVQLHSENRPPQSKTLLPPSPNHGLVRTVIAQDFDGKERIESRLIAPNIDSIRFRYLERDKEEWREEWKGDSALDPLLIESTLSLAGSSIRFVNGLAMDRQPLLARNPQGLMWGTLP